MSSTEARHAMKLRLGTDARARKPDALIRKSSIDLIDAKLETERLYGVTFVWAITAVGLVFVPSPWVIALSVVAALVAWRVHRHLRKVAERQVTRIMLSNWRVR